MKDPLASAKAIGVRGIVALKLSQTLTSSQSARQKRSAIGKRPRSCRHLPDIASKAGDRRQYRRMRLGRMMMRRGKRSEYRHQA